MRGPDCTADYKSGCAGPNVTPMVPARFRARYHAHGGEAACETEQACQRHKAQVML